MSHPHPAFRWDVTPALRAFAEARGFAHILIVDDGAPVVAYAPVTLTVAGDLRFHLARANRAARIAEGARAIASLAGPDGYVSPDWYGSADQVPTWNYLAVEAEGTLHALDEDALVAQLDRLSAVHEARLAPKPVWTRGKMTPGRFAAMLPALRGFELRVAEWRGIRKLGQQKRAAERAGAAAGMAASGAGELAALMAACA